MNFEIIQKNGRYDLTDKWTVLCNRVAIRDESIQLGEFIQFAVVEDNPFPRLFYRIIQEKDEKNSWEVKINSKQKCVQATLSRIVRKKWKIPARKKVYLSPSKTIEGWTELLVELKP